MQGSRGRRAGATIASATRPRPHGRHCAATLRLLHIAHAARILRQSGATPAQMKVGTLGIELSSVASLAKKLYETLDVHNSSEHSKKIWLGETCNDTQRFLPPGPQASSRTAQEKALSLALFLAVKSWQAATVPLLPRARAAVSFISALAN
jgi:hypothetical protein